LLQRKFAHSLPDLNSMGFLLAREMKRERARERERERERDAHTNIELGAFVICHREKITPVA
jgi:hypothetical protein